MRRTYGIVAVAALLAVLVLTVSGCATSTKEKLVGKWVTGSGVTAGTMEFTEDGVARLNKMPPTKYEVSGNEVFTVSNGKREVAGSINWVSADRFVYTVLSPGCEGLVVTYNRVK